MAGGETAPAGDQTALFWLAMYIDDVAAVSADDLLFTADGTPVMRDDGVQMRRAQAHFDVAREVLERYGWRSAPSKEQPPSMLLEVLGVEIDLRRDELRLSPAKRDRYGKQVILLTRSDGQRWCRFWFLSSLHRPCGHIRDDMMTDELYLY